jgi:transcriptional regulator with PAS, ATPase and Fis domain
MEPMAIVPAHHRPRRADRRTGLHTLVRQMAALLAQAGAGVDLLGELCGRLTRIAHARHVQVVENDGIRLGHPIVAGDYAAFATPWRRGGRQRVVEASFGSDVRPDEWTFQLLESAASLAALVMAADRSTPLIAAARAADRGDLVPLVGASEVMQSLRERVERVASTDFTILIEGESGVGKELVARQIHACSRRRHGPFVAINCAALVETLLEAELFGIEERTATGVRGRRGKFEHADGGTLFLDEVSDLSLSAQAKLLRAIQDLTVERVGGTGGRRVDVRIVAATNRSLAGLVANGVFRADVFYRLSGVEVHVPPLRFRKTDILELTQHFLERHQTRGRYTMTTAAVDALMAYDWPGNVRELERMIEGAVAIAESRQIRLDDLPACLRGDYADVLMPSAQEDHSMRAWGSRYARLVLERAGGNKREACRRLCISYHTLNAYLEYQPGQRLLAHRARLERSVPGPPASPRRLPDAIDAREC